MTDDQNCSKLIALSWTELVVIIALIVVYGWATEQRNLVWKDDLSLWSDVVKKSPGKARPYNYLGLAYQKRGRLDKAVMQYKKSISIKPFYANAHSNLGVTYFEQGLVDKAISHFKHVIEIEPTHADAHYNLGIAYGEKGLLDQAYLEIRKGIELRKR